MSSIDVPGGPDAATLPDQSPDAARAPRAGAPVAAPQSDPVARPAAETVAPPVTVVAEAAPEATDPCAASLTASPLPGALVEVTLFAPCQPLNRVVLRQGPLAVTGLTSVAGLLVTTLPAFEDPAAVTVLFADGTRIEAMTEVPDLVRFDRIAVQWMAQDAFQIHAYADGAEFGTLGHVSSAAPRAVGDRGDFVIAVGTADVDRPLRAEVYTYPADNPADVRVDGEAALTPLTCGREIIGETLHRIAGGVAVRDLTVAMPDCDDAEGYLVLQDVGADVTLAAR